MPKLIGTAGHVDHGKTSLIKALTGIDADRLPEEQKRGMTIDIGFAYLDLPGIGRTSIVDVPGHERFLTNMLAGASGIDVALLCVAADESVMPQTREHFQILELLPVEKLIVALTRADLADTETREFSTEEVKELLQGTRFAEAPILPVSATTGENLDRLRDALAEAMRQSTPKASQAWYLPIDRVFTVKGHGCVVTGTLAGGAVKAGDRAFLEPGHYEVRVRSVQSHGEAAESSEPGKRTALNLAGARQEDVRRGMMLGAPGAAFETTAFDADIRWIVEPRHGMRVRIAVGAEEVMGRVFLSRDVDWREPAIAQIRLEQPMAVALEQPVILRRYSPPDVQGGGRVVVPNAKPRRRKETAQSAAQASDDDAILAILGDNPEGQPTEEICRRLGKTTQALGDVFERLSKEGKVRGFASLWFSQAGYDSAKSRLVDALNQVHAKNPSRATLPRESAVQAAGLKWAGKPLDRLISAFAQDGVIDQHGTAIRSKTFVVQLPPRQRQLLDRLKASLEVELVNVPTPRDLAGAVGVPPQAIDEIIKLGVQANELIVVAEGVVYTPAQLDRIKTRVKEIGGKTPFTASELRDAIGTTRKYVIPLLEYLDSVRFTTRVGEKRVVN